MNNNQGIKNYSTIREILEFLPTKKGNEFKGISRHGEETTNFNNVDIYEPIINLGKYYFGIVKIDPQTGIVSASAYTRHQLGTINFIPKKDKDGNIVSYSTKLEFTYVYQTGLWWLPEEKDIDGVKLDKLSEYILDNVAIDNRNLTAETKKAMKNAQKSNATAQETEQPEA